MKTSSIQSQGWFEEAILFESLAFETLFGLANPDTKHSFGSIRVFEYVGNFTAWCLPEELLTQKKSSLWKQGQTTISGRPSFRLSRKLFMFNEAKAKNK